MNSRIPWSLAGTYAELKTKHGMYRVYLEPDHVRITGPGVVYKSAPLATPGDGQRIAQEWLCANGVVERGAP